MEGLALFKGLIGCMVLSTKLHPHRNPYERMQITDNAKNTPVRYLTELHMHADPHASTHANLQD